MKSLSRLFLYLLVALSFNTTSFAADSPKTEPKVNTELKSGEIVITEDFVVEEKTVNATKKDEEKEQVQETKEQKPAESKPETVEKKYEPISKIPVTIQKKSAEDKNQVPVETKDMPNTQVKESIDKGSPIEEITKTAEPETKKEVSVPKQELNQEIDKFIKQSANKVTDTKTQEINKTVEKVNSVVNSDKISKKDSEKIASATKSIVEEYNKKIEEAPTEAKRQELRIKAVKEINQTIKETSKEAYDIIVDDKNLKTYDQKNEKLVLEIESKDKNENDKKGDMTGRALDEVSKVAPATRSPKLSQEADSTYNPKVLLSISLIIILLLVIAFSMIFALKQRNKNKN